MNTCYKEAEAPTRMSSNAFIRYHLVIGAGNIKLEQLGKQNRKKKKKKPKGKIRSRNFKQEKHGVGTGGR